LDFAADFDAVDGCVLVTLRGTADLAALRAYHRELRAHPRYARGMPILTDISEIEAGETTTAEARQMGLAVEEFDRRMGTARRAIVAPQPLLFGLSRAAQTAMDPDGTRTFVTRSREEAIAWLRDEP
jgi:hypothetical protein